MKWIRVTDRFIDDSKSLYLENNFSNLDLPSEQRYMIHTQFFEGRFKKYKIQGQFSIIKKLIDSNIGIK